MCATPAGKSGTALVGPSLFTVMHHPAFPQVGSRMKQADKYHNKWSDLHTSDGSSKYSRSY